MVYGLEFTLSTNRQHYNNFSITKINLDALNEIEISGNGAVGVGLVEAVFR